MTILLMKSDDSCRWMWGRYFTGWLSAFVIVKFAAGFGVHATVNWLSGPATLSLM